MAVSGTTTFSTTRDELITDAFQDMTVFQDGTAPGTNDITLAARRLNFLIKAMAAKGIPIWAIQTTPVPQTVGIGTYTIGPSGAIVTANRPIRVYHAYIQNANGDSYQLQQISKQEYDFLSRKVTPGIPNQFYYEPLLDTGSLNLYPVINVTGYTVYIASQRQLYDMTLGTQTFDFPQEAYMMLKWCLAREMLAAYTVPDKVAQHVRAEAERWENPTWNFLQEEASTTFSPQLDGY